MTADLFEEKLQPQDTIKGCYVRIYTNHGVRVTNMDHRVRSDLQATTEIVFKNRIRWWVNSSYCRFGLLTLLTKSKRAWALITQR